MSRTCQPERIEPGRCRSPLGSSWTFELVYPYMMAHRARTDVIARFAGDQLDGSVTFNENALTESQASVPSGEWCSRQVRRQLTQMTPQVEGWWRRANHLVFAGPVLDVTDSRDGTLTFTLSDRMWWEDADVFTEPGRFRDEDLTRVWLYYISPRLIHLRLNAVCSGIVVDRDIEPDDFVDPTSFQAAQTVAEEGLTWTVVGDSLFVGPIDRTYAPSTTTLDDTAFDEPASYSLNGERFSTVVAVVGNRDQQPRPFGLWPATESDDTQWVRAVRPFTDDTIKTDGQAVNKARRLYERRRESDRFVAPNGVSLRVPQGPSERGLQWCPHTLIPGRVVTVDNGSVLASSPTPMVVNACQWDVVAGRDSAVQPGLRSIHET